MAGMMSFVVMKQSMRTPKHSRKAIWLSADEPKSKAPKAMAMMTPAAQMTFPVWASAVMTASRAVAPPSYASMTDSVKKTWLGGCGRGPFAW